MVTLSDTRAHRSSHTDGAFAEEQRHLMRSANGPGPSGPGPVRTTETERTAYADQPTTGPDLGRPVRAWPLLVLAAPAAVAVWSGWVGMGTMTGFGQTIWPADLRTIFRTDPQTVGIGTTRTD